MGQHPLRSTGGTPTSSDHTADWDEPSRAGHSNQAHCDIATLGRTCYHLLLERQHEFHADRDAYFAGALRQPPELAEVFGGGRRVRPIRAVTKWDGYFRQSAGSGWVLVGDAGHFKDPTPGQGISDALRQREQLAHTIDNALGIPSFDAAIQRWWCWRDDGAYEMYWFASLMGQPGAYSALMTRLPQDISVDADASRSFLRLLNHDVRPSQLFIPAILACASGGAIRDELSRIVATLKEALGSTKRNMRQARQKRLRPPGMTNAAWRKGALTNAYAGAADGGC